MTPTNQMLAAFANEESQARCDGHSKQDDSGVVDDSADDLRFGGPRPQPQLENDITQRMRYQSANSLRIKQLEKRRGRQAKFNPSSAVKQSNHDKNEVSCAGKDHNYSGLSVPNEAQRVYSVSRYVATCFEDTTDKADFPSQRLPDRRLNDLGPVKSSSETDEHDFDTLNRTGFNRSTFNTRTIEDEDYNFQRLLNEIQQPNFKRYPSDARQLMTPDNLENHHHNSATIITQPQIAERLFMTSLVKHTAIALAIIIPLAAVTAYAAEPDLPVAEPVMAAAQSGSTASDLMTSNHTRIQVGQVALEPMAGMANPATVASVDLSRYAGQWYEIARLPMYFQRNCAADVTATYTPSANSDSISVVNKCLSTTGKEIVANGEAVPADASGSKLKVTFLPSWLRWAPFGKADYWVLALDDDYQSALVGTPNKKYLWLLSRSPSMDTETYQTYRKIAQNQGYNLADFTLTIQTGK